jgi:hypothetical protein
MHLSNNNNKDIIDAIKRRAELYSSLNVMMDEKVKHAMDNVRRAPKVSKVLSRAGWMMFWLPEPTMISTLVGIPMILAGKALSKYYNDLTVKGVVEETAKMLKSMEEFRYSLVDK